MNKRLGLIAIMFLCGLWAQAQTCVPGNGVTCTPNLNLWLPPANYPNWNVPTNANWSTVDTFLGGSSALPNGLTITGKPLVINTTPVVIPYEAVDGTIGNNVYGSSVVSNPATFAGNALTQDSVIASFAAQPRVSSTNAAHTIAPTGIFVAPRIESSSVNAPMVLVGGTFDTIRAGTADLSNAVGTITGVGTYSGHSVNLPSSATTTNIRGGQFYQTLQSGVATNMEGVYTTAIVGSASGPAGLVLPNNYGLYIDTPVLANGATITNDYGVYVADATAANYFAGGISVGSTAAVVHGISTGSATLTFGAIAAGSAAQQSFTMTAPYPNKGVVCSPQGTFGGTGPFIWQSLSLSANTVSVLLLNLGTASATPAAVSWGCTVFN